MLKYLFKALLKNDTLIEQNQEDQGSVSGKNCFYDVLQQMDNLRAFALYHQETGEEWLVDLNDGHFEHNVPVKDENTGEILMQGSSFKLHGDKEFENLRLIWFMKRELVLDVTNTEVISNQITSYHFGWQANLKSTGENKEFVVMVW